MNNENSENLVCVNCGEVLTSSDMTYQDNGDIFCEKCFFENHNRCDECGEYIHENDTYYIDGYAFCENCSTDCEICGTRIRINDEESHDIDGNFICQNCFENNYSECYNCGETIPSGVAWYNEEGDCAYCEECYREHYSSDVLGYHSFNEWHEFRLDNERTNVPLIGYELEIDRGCNEKKAVQLITKNLNAVCERDGSLSNDGIEIVSHPQSYKYIMKYKNDVKKVFEGLQNLGYKSHDTGCCGLHIHVTKPSDDVIDRILFVMETYKNELQLFARRSSGIYTHFISDQHDATEDLQSLEYIKEIKGDFSCDRYMALSTNTSTGKTIEFRIFKGTLKFETFLASIELVNNIVKMCSNLSLPLEKITWSELTKTKYANSYCLERGIHSNKVPSDLTEFLRMKRERELEKIQVCIKKIQFVIENELKNFKGVNFEKWDNEFMNLATSVQILKMICTRDFKTLIDFKNALNNRLNDINNFNIQKVVQEIINEGGEE